VAVTIAVDGGGATALRTAFVELADRDHAAPAGPAMAPPLLGEAPGGARRAGDDLVAVVSHDLRSPLSAITLSVAHLLRASPPDERRASRKQVEVIQRAAEHMTRLIDDLLIATTLQAGRLAVDLHPTRLDQLVADALTILEPAARARAIELVAEVRASRPEACCDRERIHQVVANLVHNAIRFTPEGGRITIVIEAHGAELWTSVVDGGPGIPAEELPDLFHRYQQGATRAGSGVGLGLYICQGIVAHHGGRIWAEPGPAGGAAFSFSLPAVPPAP
jgi:signal transduction histidine kinase